MSHGLQILQPLSTPSFAGVYCRIERAQWLQQMCNHCARSVLQNTSRNCTQTRACTFVAQFVQPLCTHSFAAKLDVQTGCPNCATIVKRPVVQKIIHNCIRHLPCTMVAQFVQPLCMHRVAAQLGMHKGCTNCATIVHAQSWTQLRAILCKTGRAQWAHKLCAHCARPVSHKMRRNGVQT